MISNENNNEPKFEIGQLIMTVHGKAKITKIVALPENPDVNLLIHLGAEDINEYNWFRNIAGNALYDVSYENPYKIRNFSYEKFEKFTNSIGIDPIKIVQFRKKYMDDPIIYGLYEEMEDTDILSDEEIIYIGKNEQENKLSI